MFQRAGKGGERHAVELSQVSAHGAVIGLGGEHTHNLRTEDVCSLGHTHQHIVSVNCLEQRLYVVNVVERLLLV